VETIHHLLVGCVFSRQIWAHVLQQLDLIHLAPKTAGSRFFGWWRRSSLAVPKEARKGLNSLIILITWEIWKHRNACVFDHVRPNTQEVLRAVDTEGSLWCMAGASKLQELVSRSLSFSLSSTCLSTTPVCFWVLECRGHGVWLVCVILYLTCVLLP
jgi:hypothetical protein